MRLFYIVALVPTILAADLDMRDSQTAEAQSMENSMNPDTVRQLIEQECSDLPPNCFENLQKMLGELRKPARPGKGAGGGGGPDRECISKLTECAKRISPKFAGGNGRASPN